MKRIIYILAAALFVVLTGCSNEQFPVQPCPDGNTEATLSGDLQPFFDNNCTGCHNGGQDPNLVEGASYGALTDGDEYVNLVSPCSSTLYEYVAKGHNGSYEEEDELNVLGWIQEGANDN